jgi:hypothetical protein
MFPDPVVQEMRDNFAKIAEECGNDFDRIAERVRREQAAHADRLVSHLGAPRTQARQSDLPRSTPH